MTITKFRETYKDGAVMIPVSAIGLTEHCHIKAVKKEHKVSKMNNAPMCIVRRDEDGKYALIIGYRDYITARNSGAEEVRAIVIQDKSRKDFLKSLDITPELWNTADVHEPNGWTAPNQQKVINCIKNYEATGTFGKSIVISPDGTILDGYAAVCAARQIGINIIPIYVITTQRWTKLSNKSKKSKKNQKTLDSMFTL